MICVYAVFHHFSQHIFFASWFLFRLNRIFQVHDVTINFSFVLFSFIFLSFFFWMVYFGQCHMLWMAFHLEAYLFLWGSFWKGWLLVRGCLYHFFPEDMAQKYSRKMGNFWSTCPRHQLKMILKYHGLGTFFLVIERVLTGLKLLASLDAYQITKYQFFQKLVIFFVAWFSKNSRKSFWNRNFRANCLSRRDQKVYSIF